MRGHERCVTDSAFVCPRVGSWCNYFLHEHALLPGTWTSGNVHGHAYRRVFRSTENVKDCVSPTGASSEHLAGTFQTLTKHDGWGKATVKGFTTLNIPSSNSRGIVAGEEDCTTTAYTCSSIVCLPPKTVFFHCVLMGWMGTQRKWQWFTLHIIHSILF